MELSAGRRSEGSQSPGPPALRQTGRERRRRPGFGLLTFAALVAGLAIAARADGQDAMENIDPRLGEAFRSAVLEAATRLRDPACAAVLGDFRDRETGRTLTEELDETGYTAAEYFSRLLTFRSGLGLHPCQHSEVTSFTWPDSRRIYICRQQFHGLQRKDAGRAANTLIHEALHSLGLGETPPDPKAITARVQERCGP